MSKKTNTNISPGIDALLPVAMKLIGKRRVALLANHASITSSGVPTAIALKKAGVNICAFFGPEHGFYGTAAAGTKIKSENNANTKVPIFSLYGEIRKPTDEMLSCFDVLIYDIQDIGARPYTFVATLRYMMEAMSGKNKELIVTDRIIPLPHLPDGPVLNPAFESFISSINAPMLYAMTPAETALWLKETLNLDVKLTVFKVSPPVRHGWEHTTKLCWIPPSPSITSWESAMCYTATVFSEALPDIYVGRGTGMSFRILGTKWTNSIEILSHLKKYNIEGIDFFPYRFAHHSVSGKEELIDGIRLHINNPYIFKPVTTGIYLLYVLNKIRGRKLWEQHGARPSFFDRLYGTDLVRKLMQNRVPAIAICNKFTKEIKEFCRLRERSLLYE